MALIARPARLRRRDLQLLAKIGLAAILAWWISDLLGADRPAFGFGWPVGRLAFGSTKRRPAASCWLKVLYCWWAYASSTKVLRPNWCSRARLTWSKCGRRIAPGPPAATS